jgi:hypothetical protein
MTGEPQIALHLLTGQVHQPITRISRAYSGRIRVTFSANHE